MEKPQGIKRHLEENWWKYALGLIAIVIVFLIPYHKIFDFLDDFTNANKIKVFIDRYGKYSALAFIIFEIVEVIIFIIPGQVMQVVGGCIFGTFKGAFYALVGVTIGSWLTYYIAHSLGRDFVNKLSSGGKMEYYENILKGRNYKLIIFVLYFIPGIPKDFLCYVIGISSVPFKDFIIYSTIARIPSVILSTYFGTQIIQKHTGIIVTIAVIAIIAGVIFVVFRKKIMDKVGKAKINPQQSK